MRTPRTYYAAIAAFCAVCLVIGFAGATDQSAPEKIPYPKNWTGKAGDKIGQPFSAEQMILHLEENGIDVTEVKAALANGDTDAVKEWFAKQGRPDRNPDKETPDFAAHIARFEENGIDVTEVKAALANGDTDAVKEWFAKQGRPDRNPDKGTPDKGTPDFAAHIARLEENGIDVTEVKAALANGDTDAVKEWLDTHMGEGRPGDGSQFREGKQGHRAGEAGQ